MASSSSPLTLKSLHHGRSLSLPSISHSSTSQFNQTFSTLAASSDATSSSSFSSLNEKVTCLKNLYCNLDNFLLLPHSQHIISQEPQNKWVDQVLEGHVSLLDACNTTRDLFSQMKHNIQELLSALRRKDTHGVRSYLTSRRKLQKMIQKSLKDLKSPRSKNTISIEKDNESKVIVCELKEAESVTFAMLESLLSYVALNSKMLSRQTGWSLVSKLMHSRKISDQGEGTHLNEFEKVDALLQKSQEDATRVEELVNHLKGMDLSIQSLEDELECLFRELIKTRVFLLNIHNY